MSEINVAKLDSIGGNLTINADGASSEIVLQKNGTQVGTIGSAGFTGDVVGNTTGNVTGNVTGNITGDLTSTAITETVTAKSAAFTPNLTSDGTIFSVTGAVAVTMPTVVNGKSFTIVASAPVSSWAGATIKWPSATVPTGTGIVIYTFVASGSQWYGFEAGNAFG